MKIGFSGTQFGMTAGQKLQLTRLLVELRPTEFHHGDCVGADKQAHELVRALPFKVKIVGHPPLNQTKQAGCKCDEYFPRDEYLARNRAIVDATDWLVITPKTATEELRSGTWSTWRYAQKVGKTLEIIAP